MYMMLVHIISIDKLFHDMADCMFMYKFTEL